MRCHHVGGRVDDVADVQASRQHKAAHIPLQQRDGCSQRQPRMLGSKACGVACQHRHPQAQAQGPVSVQQAGQQPFAHKAGATGDQQVLATQGPPSGAHAVLHMVQVSLRQAE